ncbi:DUF2239 family protein [Pelagibius marinus]|uniref:DUF2239 family protein n=1 Tax=Pelagibius marinus TaxID=2762760 RepID=UPI00187237E4|nr:DUF2239 family protein [Pelagibius marinus]
MSGDSSFTAFEGHKRLAQGDLAEVTLAVKAAEEHGCDAPLLVFEDSSGRVVDVDTRGEAADILARRPASQAEEAAAPRRRGRPKLGVVPREVTLLPRHWDWLARQPGGASAALRRLVEAARRNDRNGHVAARDAAYRFMSALAGDLPGFEEATRALFAGRRDDFNRLIASWPADLSDHCRKMTARAFPESVSQLENERAPA